MSYIPANTKNYLVSLMEQKINNHPDDWKISFKTDYRVKFGDLREQKEKEQKPLDPSKMMPPVKDPSKFKGGGKGGGAGSGEPAKPGSGDMTPDNILFGDETGLGSFGIAYGLGKAADIASRFIPQKAIQAVFQNSPDLQKYLGPTVYSIIKKLGQGIADLSGSSYVDVNVDDIPYQNMRNVISGAGRPFYALQVPIRRDDPMDYWRRSYLAQQPQP